MGSLYDAGFQAANALHPLIRSVENCETELAIEAVSVTGCKEEARQALQVRMGKDRGHKPLADPLAAISIVDKHIT